MADAMCRACTLASRFGILAVIAVPGRGKSPDCSSGAGALRRLKKIGRDYGVSVLYEMLGFRDFAFAGVSDAYQVAAEAGVRLVLDTVHLAVAGAGAEEIAELPEEAIGLVHLSDAVTAGKAVGELEDSDRVLPGEGALPLVEILSGIRATGYIGAASVEVFHPKYGREDSRSVALAAYRRLRELLRRAKW